MKLLFCPICSDIIKLDTHERSCKCGRSRGAYLEDGLKAWVSGEAYCLGISNTEFIKAFAIVRDNTHLPENLATAITNFRAWVFHPDRAPNVEYRG